ncbi:3-hydroxyacyl-CoA dehydrogenase [Roseiterribacter gracilis]|uniref:3-hydroxyacyl-CoA dehydrogenase n=1 Tax=Roseiterribacter gracilis TaxID=2812848 RepID=A0A8S8X8J4_9PROT|nr:3-hydroxyacyl-CoA dehydrogenase [Rhodospirillales bacterium TMPK1]
MSLPKTIAVIGAGVMGRGIAQLACSTGAVVRLYDVRPDAIDDAIAFIGKMLLRQAEKGTIARADADRQIANLHAAATLTDLADVDLVIEAAREDLATKQQLFKELETIVGKDTILASNTSSLSITALAAACADPARVAGLHFFNPAPLMKVVEVIPAVQTAEVTVARLTDFVHAFGHRAVRAEDSPGFLINHAGRGLGTEALRILQEGIAPVEEIDRVVRDVIGLKMGPFELFDLTGMDVSSAVLTQIHAGFEQDPRLRSSHLARRQVEAGRFGRKSGRGWYEYDGDKRIEPNEPPSNADLRPVWVEPNADASSWLRTLVVAAGAPLDTGATPDDASLLLVSPLGQDATVTATALGLDPTRTVAVDSWLGRGKRRGAMTTSVTRPAYREAARAVLTADGSRVTITHDSPGFVAPRILANIVNTAADIAQQRIATPADIDDAVRLGLGYPMGPLSLGDKYGPTHIVAVLDAMADFYGDPRYRVSPWLRRRAMLGVSLLTPES